MEKVIVYTMIEGTGIFALGLLSALGGRRRRKNVTEGRAMQNEIPEDLRGEYDKWRASGFRAYESGLICALIERVARLRGLVIACGRNAGALLADQVSDELLSHIPEEVRLRIATLEAQLATAQATMHAVVYGGTPPELIRDGGDLHGTLALTMNGLLIDLAAAQKALATAQAEADNEAEFLNGIISGKKAAIEHLQAEVQRMRDALEAAKASESELARMLLKFHDLIETLRTIPAIQHLCVLAAKEHERRAALSPLPASAVQPVNHAYTSTACFHGQHDRCRRECKFCAAHCQCSCHAAQPEGAE